MLVLSLRTGDGALLRIPGMDPVRVVVTKAERGKASVAFEAPMDINIVREELLRKGDPCEDDRNSKKPEYYPNWHGKAFSTDQSNRFAEQ